MPRLQKYEGLREAFFDWLRENQDFDRLSSDKTLTSSELVAKLSADKAFRDKKKINDDKMAFLERNSANFFSAASDEGIVYSPKGRWGYRRKKEDDDYTLEQPTKTKNKKNRNTQPEACLHFFATPVLSSLFKAQVISMPKINDKGYYANPDMIMMRKTFYSLLNMMDIDTDIFRQMDSSPDYTISSVELKVNLISRSDFAKALSETAINGKWAHENWLIYINIQNDSSYEIDPDLLSFAQTNNVGIAEIKFNNFGEQNEFEKFELDIQVPSVRANILNLNVFENRKNFLLKLQQEFDFFSKKGTYYDAESNVEQLMCLLNRSCTNLNIISGQETGRLSISKILDYIKNNIGDENMSKRMIDAFVYHLDFAVQGMADSPLATWSATENNFNGITHEWVKLFVDLKNEVPNLFGLKTN